MVRFLRDDVGISCIIKHSADAEVYLVAEGIPEERVADDGLGKRLGEVIQAHKVELERIELVEEALPVLACETVGHIGNRAPVLRPVLVVV